MDVTKVVIAKLNGTNYLVWATQMQALLQARDLWKHVGEPMVSVPTVTAAGTSGNEDAKEECMARAMIICGIEAEFIPMVAAEQNPRKVWKLLADANNSKCTASIHTLRNRLLNMRMEQGTTIREFANAICTIERELAFAGKTIDNDDKKYALLNGLRDEYAIKKTILQESYGISFEQMVSSLELTEDEINSKGKQHGTPSSSS